MIGKYWCLRLFSGLALLTSFTASLAREATLTWDLPNDHDVSGYRVSYGTSSGAYTQTLDAGRKSFVKVSDLQDGNTYYFVVQSYTADGLESLPSNEATFTASATPLPVSFAASAASYSGIVVEGTGGLNAQVSLNLTRSGTFSGRLLVGAETAVLKGKFSAEGALTVTCEMGDQVRTLTLQLDTDAGNIHAALSDGSRDVALTLTPDAYSKLNTTLAAGKYTMLLGPLAPSSGSPANIPEGPGYATATITPDGVIRATGKLSDGQAFAVSSTLKADSRFEVYSVLYQKAQGILAGAVQLRETPNVSDADGTLWWSKPPQRSGRYRQGFSGTTSLIVSRWHKVLLGEGLRDLQGTAAPAPVRVTLSGGDLPPAMDPLQKDIIVGSRNAVTVLNPGPDRFQLSIQSVSGLLRGRYVHPVDGGVRTVQGVVFLKQNRGAGFFTGIENTGSFELTGILP